ncbi:thiamine pyrophosphokinase [Shimia isoporae]|uniref:Thiamine diphosphokinase n=1 Tax=Shimia isoporae TaxID=647720 RepID=A0A4R1NMQ4_9RHOB|nr:thiamine diphosphokinase [Shimia isoporae]TCL09021.1 thiamine pyrophosphokinase [Shimia isoporae]
MTAIVESLELITLVGAGSLTNADVIEATQVAPRVVAADGGAAHCLDFELAVEAVIGDFDSIPARVLSEIPANRMHRIAEQETTDFDKALRSIEAPLVVGIGFGGARVDHHLAAFNTLVRLSHRQCVLLGGEDVVFTAPPKLTLDLAAGTRVSLFPMTHLTGRSEGLEWPLEGLSLAPNGRVGTSNAAKGPVHLEVGAPGMLVILPRSCLQEAVRALTDSGASWPVP